MVLKIENLYTFHMCRHPKIGMLKSGCFEYSAELYPGINFLFGELTDNGWACTYAVSKGEPKWIFEGNFFIDGEEVSLKELRQLTYYVAYDELRFPMKKIRLNTALNMCKGWSAIKDDVCRHFELNEGKDAAYIMNRRFEQMQHFVYLCSCLLGIAKGKKIFCFPWIHQREIPVQSYRFRLLSEYALSNGLIIIIPTPQFADQVETYPFKFVIG